MHSVFLNMPKRPLFHSLGLLLLLCLGCGFAGNGVQAQGHRHAHANCNGHHGDTLAYAHRFIHHGRHGDHQPHDDHKRVYQQMPSMVQVVFDSILLDMETYHAYRHEMDWEALRQDALSTLCGLQVDSVQHLAPALQLAIDQLRDHHGRFMHGQGPIVYFQNWDAVRSTDERPRNGKLARAIGYAEYPHMAQLLPNGVAYIRICGVSPYEDPNAVAQRIRHLVDSLHALQSAVSSRAVKPWRWIVDLRYNGGGNIFPMATGLAPLFELGPYGHSVDADGDTVGTWRINLEGFERDGYQPARLAHQPGALQGARVACLVSRYTVSSGEILALGFAGRSNSRLFGEDSGGYTTETNWAPYRNGLLASYAISHYANKDGTVYHQAVPVDQSVHDSESGSWYHNGSQDGLDADPVVQMANAWLFAEGK